MFEIVWRVERICVKVFQFCQKAKKDFKSWESASRRQIVPFWQSGTPPHYLPRTKYFTSPPSVQSLCPSQQSILKWIPNQPRNFAPDQPENFPRSPPRKSPKKVAPAKGRGYHPADPFMATPDKENPQKKTREPETPKTHRLIPTYVTQFTLCHSFPVRHFATDSTLNGTLYGTGAWTLDGTVHCVLRKKLTFDYGITN